MKFKVTFKDPDSLHDAINDAVKEDLDKTDLPEDEKEILFDARQEKYKELCRTWFEYSEYVTLEIDTEARTCVVVPVKG